MAAIFLSYAREDSAKAKALAEALGEAGHEVWWDRHIRSGSEFAGEIEAALNRADAVVVLWSAASVGSAWVRDEAAEGRDSGRLVPLMIDGARPPIGFRQYQALDFSSWSGRGTPQRFDELLADLAGRGPPREQDPQRIESPSRRAPARLARKTLLSAALALALLVAALGAYFLLIRSGPAKEPTIAVLPFSDLSPQRDKGYIAEGIAEAVLSILGRQSGIDVIGRASAAQFEDRPGDLEEIRKALGVTHIVEGSARTGGDQLRVTVRLVDALTGKEVWTEDYQRPMSNIFAVQDEIGRAVAASLKGNLAPAEPGAIERTGVDTYTLYLAARAKKRERRVRPLQEALQLARQIIEMDPSYGGGHALFAEVTMHLSEESYGTIPVATASRIAEAHARRAIALAPNSAEGYAALHVALGSWPAAAIVPLRRAIELDPSRSELRFWLGLTLNDLGYNSEAIENYRLVVELDPLFPQAVRFLAHALAASGDYHEAEEVARAFERRGGSPGWVAFLRSDAALLRGDSSAAVRLLQLAHRERRDFRPMSLALAFAYHHLGLFDAAERLAAGEKPLVRSYLANRTDDAVPQIRASASKSWLLFTMSAPYADLDLAATLLANARDWKTLALIYDKLGRNKEICRAPFAALHFATAMKATGRAADLSALLRCVEETLAVHQTGEYRSPKLGTSELTAARANLLALQDRRAEALSHMRGAVSLGYRTPYGKGLSHFPAFDPFRSSAQYRALDEQLKRLIAAERIETLRSL